MAKRALREPPHKMAKKCIDLRWKRKQNIDIGDKAYTFCTRIFGKYPDWYYKVEEKVFGTWTRCL